MDQSNLTRNILAGMSLGIILGSAVYWLNLAEDNFFNVYLIDAKNNSDMVLSKDPVNGHENEAFQMAAEFLYLKFKPSDPP